MTIVFLILLAIVLAEKAISYYGATLGLLYYIGMKHDDLLDADKVKELRNAALKRRFKELFGGN